MKGRAALAGSFLFMVALLGAGFPAQAEIAARLVRVIDGDSLVVRTPEGNRIISLAGIDAPETGQPFAARTRQEVLNLTRQKTFLLRSAGIDPVGRPSAEVILPDQSSLNQKLVAAGLAWAREDSALGRRFKPLEENARREKRGLWADPKVQTPKEFRQQGRVISAPAKAPVAQNAQKDNVPFAVFVEPGHSLYHLRGCRVIRGEAFGLPLQMARENKLIPCSVCRPPF